MEFDCEKGYKKAILSRKNLLKQGRPDIWFCFVFCGLLFSEYAKASFPRRLLKYEKMMQNQFSLFFEALLYTFPKMLYHHPM